MAKSVLLQELKRGAVSFCPVGRWISAGRASSTNEVVCKDKHVSRNHCRLQAQPDGSLRIVDRSSFGTFINGEKLGGETYANQGDEIILGSRYVLRVLGMLDDDASMEANTEPCPPQRMGASYLLLREVGRGGMGIVYEAWDEAKKRRVAVKWLREGGQAAQDHMDRFKREVMLQGRLSDYPGVVKVFDLGKVTGSGEMFCVMEFVDGTTMLDKIREGIEIEDGVRLLTRISRAVDYMHEEGIIHRDIKPGNIMITPDGAVRLTDFGIARALEREGFGRTMTGIMLGTPGYMAPEQIKDAKRADFQSDIYALGAVLYTLLTGKLPVRGKSLAEALENVRKGKKPPKPSAHNPDADPELEAICLRALAYDPKKRWSSAAEFGEELEAWLKSRAPPPKVQLSGPLKQPQFPPTLESGAIKGALRGAAIPRPKRHYPPTRRCPPIV